MQRPTGVCIHRRDGSTIDFDGDDLKYLGQDDDGIHQWTAGHPEYIWAPGDEPHIGMLPARTTLEFEIRLPNRSPTPRHIDAPAPLVSLGHVLLAILIVAALALILIVMGYALTRGLPVS